MKNSLDFNKLDKHTTDYKKLNCGVLPIGKKILLDPKVSSFTLMEVSTAFVEQNRLGVISDTSGRRLCQKDIDNFQQKIENAGILAGDRVIVVAEMSIDTVVMMITLWRNGCAVCPVEPNISDKVMQLIQSKSKARAVINSNQGITLLGNIDQSTDFLLRSPKNIVGNDDALLIFTSGSSGNPKGVLLSHQNVLSALRAISKYLRLTPSDSILAIPPFFFDYGLYQILFAMFIGCQLVIPTKSKNVIQIAQTIIDVQPSVLPIVPALAIAIPKSILVMGKTISKTRLITNTGGHLTEAAIKKLSNVFPNTRYMAMYGLTECKRALYYERSVVACRPGSVGFSMPGLETAVRRVDSADELQSAGIDETGELMVRGSAVMQGYLGASDPGSGAKLIQGYFPDDIWMATGDLMRVDTDGYHFFQGRLKLLIKQAGYCINPREIEEEAEEDSAVSTAVVVGRMDESGDESAVIFIELQDNFDQDELIPLKTRMGQRLPRSHMPREFRIVQDWPRTPNGKIDRGLLTQMSAQKVNVR